MLITGGMLLYGSDYNYQEHFKLPTREYEDYLRWVDNAGLSLEFRIELGVFVVL